MLSAHRPCQTNTAADTAANRLSAVICCSAKLSLSLTLALPPSLHSAEKQSLLALCVQSCVHDTQPTHSARVNAAGKRTHTLHLTKLSST